MEKISVVLPCYNHGKYVAEAIQSVLDQTYTNFELFVFDNGSSDNSWEEICKFDDPRMTKIRLEKNDLLSVKLQFIEKSTGRYCAIMHSDDVWLKEKLAKQMDFLSAHPEARICLTWSEQVDEKLETLGVQFNEPNKTQQDWCYALLTRTNYISFPSFIGEKELYIKYFGCLYPYRQVADVFTWLKILGETNLHMIEEILLLQRVHGEDKEGTNVNESYPSEENGRRGSREMLLVRYRVIDEMEDDFFMRVFCGKSVEGYTHLDVMCEKFLLFLRGNGKMGQIWLNAVRYYETYFAYTDGKSIFYQYLKEKYGFSREDFFEVIAKDDKSDEISASRARRWAKLENTDFSSLDYPEKLSIYGCGFIGKVLCRRIMGYCTVEQFIDRYPRRDPYSYRGVPVYKTDKAKLDGDSVIVIVPTYDYEEIVEELLKLYPSLQKENMIRFEDFLDTGYFLDFEY